MWKNVDILVDKSLISRIPNWLITGIATNVIPVLAKAG